MSKPQKPSVPTPRPPQDEVERHSTTLPPAPVAAPVVRHVVAKGRSVTSLRGILETGSEVNPRDFSGEGSLEALVAAGIVLVVEVAG